MNLDSHTLESLGEAKPSDTRAAYSRLASGGQVISVAALGLGLSTLAAVLAPFRRLSIGLLCFSGDGGLPECTRQGSEKSHRDRPCPGLLQLCERLAQYLFSQPPRVRPGERVAD